jgi:hypothetical protein
MVDCVFVGRITALEEKPVNARLYFLEKAETEFHLAQVQVQETFAGSRDQKSIRVGFLGSQKPSHKADEEGCFLGLKHPDEDFYVVVNWGLLAKNSKTYEKDLALARRCCRLLEKPEEALKSNEAEDRLLTAHMLLYRHIVVPLCKYEKKVKVKPIDADQSKLIMLALADADWSRPSPLGFKPQTVLRWLRGLTEAPGSPLSKSIPEESMDLENPEATCKWLRDHAETFRIPGLVPPAAEDKGNDKPAKPAEQYKALLKEYDKDPRADKLAPRFLELAEKNPKDPVAADALIWVVNYAFDSVGGKESARAKAIDHLLRDHVMSDKLGQVAGRMTLGYYKEFEAFLRTVLEKNPHQDVQGQACLALAQFLNNRLRMLDLVKDRQDLARFYEDVLGKDYFNDLRRQDSAKVAKEAEALFERAAEKYAEVKASSRGTVGERAKAELFEIRHLAVGKDAPDIEGVDQDGKKFKLSEYRGKVVLLDFSSLF